MVPTPNRPDGGQRGRKKNSILEKLAGALSHAGKPPNTASGRFLVFDGRQLGGNVQFSQKLYFMRVSPFIELNGIENG